VYLLAHLSRHLFAHFFRHIMAFFIWHALFNISTNLPGNLCASCMGGDHLHLVARGLAKRPCTLGHAVGLDATLANTFTILKNLLEASWFVLSSDSLLALGFLNYIALIFLSLGKGFLADHFVFIMTFLMERFGARLHWDRYFISARFRG